MIKEEFAKHQDRMFEELRALRDAGQKEYAGGEDAFGNFNRLSERLDISREFVLWVYLTKHLDGIESYIKGHRSQRESVGGRIRDAIVYLQMLDGMIHEDLIRQKDMNDSDYRRRMTEQMTNITYLTEKR